jgi:2-succinyl-6-hydroxy-2,4-cyclohexadiene-1-carboxylate synthase
MEPLVLLHGFTGSPRSWDSVLAHLQGVSCLVQELPGHAPGFAPRVGFEANVDAVAAQIGARLRGPCHLVGYSLGARLALGLLARHRALFARVTLLSVHPGLSSVAQRRERQQADARWVSLLRRDGLATFVDAWEKLPLFTSQGRVDPQRLEDQRAIRMTHDAEQLARSLEQMGLAQMPDYRAALRRWGKPLRIITGADDPKFCALGREIAALDTRFQLLALADCGHNPLLEAPASCAAALQAPTARRRSESPA